MSDGAQYRIADSIDRLTKAIEAQTDRLNRDIGDLSTTVNACLVGVREAIENQTGPDYRQELLDLTDAVESLGNSAGSP